jgi:hypothetical protein
VIRDLTSAKRAGSRGAPAIVITTAEIGGLSTLSAFRRALESCIVNLPAKHTRLVTRAANLFILRLLTGNDDSSSQH